MSEESNDEKMESKDTSKDTPVPKNIDKLLKKEKNQDISYDERDELFSFLKTVEDIRNLVQDDPYNFSDTEYSRMMKAKVRHGARQKAGKALKDPGAKLRTKESEDFDEFLTDFWSQARDIGVNVVQRYTKRASELGYYSEEMESVDMRGFTEEAIEFFINERPKVSQRRQMLAALQASVNCTKIMLTTQRETIRKLAMQILQLTEKHDISIEELAPVRGILNQVAGGERSAGRRR